MVHDPQKGVHTIAARHIAAGELIFRHEEQPHRLVSKTHVQQHWNETFQRFFVDYCWPISDNVYGMWDHEPVCALRNACALLLLLLLTEMFVRV